MYSVTIKFETLEDFLSVIETVFEQGDFLYNSPEKFTNRKNLKKNIFSLVDEYILYWKEYKIDNYDIEIGDYYLDEFLSKFEPELWTSIEEIKNKI